MRQIDKNDIATLGRVKHELDLVANELKQDIRDLKIAMITACTSFVLCGACILYLLIKLIN